VRGPEWNLRNFGALFLFLGPIVLLFAGTLVTLALGSRWRGVRKDVALAVGPVLTFAITVGATVLVDRLCDPVEREGLLLGGAAMALYLLGLFVYYPTLLVRALAHLGRGRTSGTPPRE
jgi:hypothetical protein